MKLRNRQGIDLQDRTARNDGHFDYTPVLAAGHQDQQQRGQYVRKSCVKRPHDARTPRSPATLIIDRSSSVDFGGESRESPLERGSIFARLVLLVDVLLD